ncbi:hypothetical protein P3X46_026214 [Hevea brasiliensis]|uniref:Carbohydrate kinase PfkB domain-containing protein n=1 Tax=Hevea brasiliensis TaxID=3981 RepID=A0ABQ9KWQ2_HEVBR|nr:hypothetical protein P3X46_026214 [Hevea brasiliensis]
MVLAIHAPLSIHRSPRTTTPGKVQYALGGVARNIAECVLQLATKPYLISAVGIDMAGNMFWSTGILLAYPQKVQLCDVWNLNNVWNVSLFIAIYFILCS